MLTGELKNKVDKIWESFWTGGCHRTIHLSYVYETIR